MEGNKVKQKGDRAVVWPERGEDNEKKGKEEEKKKGRMK